MIFRLRVVLTLLILSFSFRLGGTLPDIKITYNDNDPLLLGNPSNATLSEAYKNNYLIRKPAYCLSYNSEKSIPNWVSWHLDETDFGTAKRVNNFRPDTDIPSSWFRVKSTSYKGSGFDRGHSCPSADRTSSVEMNSMTFLMSNIIPQAPNNNQGVWANLEEYARNLVKNGNELYIIMGSYGEGGIGSKGYAKTIDNSRVTVPSRIWKVIVILKRGNNDLKRIDKNTITIAVDIPNVNNISSNWIKYRTSINSIEKATGYNLLSNIPETIQNTIESNLSESIK